MAAAETLAEPSLAGTGPTTFGAVSIGAPGLGASVGTPLQAATIDATAPATKATSQKRRGADADAGVGGWCLMMDVWRVCFNSEALLKTHGKRADVIFDYRSLCHKSCPATRK